MSLPRLTRALHVALTFIALTTGCNWKSSYDYSSESKPAKVVFIGDSISQLWGDSEYSPAFLQNSNWIDKGISGQTSAQVLARFSSDVIQAHPDIVHILVGTNDVYPGWQMCQATTINTCANIQAMVAESEAAGIRVILGTIPPWGLGVLSEAADPTPARYTRINDLNSWLKRYGTANGIKVLDYHSVLQASNGEQYVPSLTADGVHPSAAGFSLMSAIAEQAIAGTP